MSLYGHLSLSLKTCLSVYLVTWFVEDLFFLSYNQACVSVCVCGCAGYLFMGSLLLMGWFDCLWLTLWVLSLDAPRCFRDSFGDPYRDSYRDFFRGSFRESLRDPFRDSFMDFFRDPYWDYFRDSYRDYFRDSFKDPYRDYFRDSFKDSFKDPYKDFFLTGSLSGSLRDPFEGFWFSGILRGILAGILSVGTSWQSHGAISRPSKRLRPTPESKESNKALLDDL